MIMCQTGAWTDDQQGVNPIWQYEWAAKRVGMTGNWGKFSAPANWAKFSTDVDAGIEFIYRRTQTSTSPSTPTTTTLQDGMDDFVPALWTDDQQGVNPTSQYEWVSKRIGSTEDWGKFTAPALWAKFSTDGAGIEFIYRRTTTNSRPPTPVTDSTDDSTDDFVPTNWTDDITGVNQTNSYEWVSKRVGSTEDWGKFQIPQLLALFSEDGEDGVGIEYVYARTQNETAPSTPTTSHLTGWYG